MPSRSNPKPSREWGLKDMEHPDAAIREVLLIALEKYESEGEPVILTTDEINAEIVRRGLRDPRSLEGKVKGALIGAYRKRESMSNLRPPLFIPVDRGTYQLNLYYLDKLRQFRDLWGSGKLAQRSPEASRISRVERYLESLYQEVNRFSAKLDAIAEQVGSLLAEDATQLSFVHTSPYFAGSEYGVKVTSIKDTIGDMLQRARRSIRISTRQMDMFEDELIRLKQSNPDLEITVISRGPEGAAGDRRKLAGAAFERMKKAGINMLIEKHVLHSRMVVIDDQEVLVSSADLDYTQMEKEFNSGIWTTSPDVVAEAIRYFDNLTTSPTVIVPK